MKFCRILILNILLLLLLIITSISCKTSKNSSENQCLYEKVKFDLTKLDNEGRIGPEKGKTTIDYEFCIPNDSASIKQVMEIDASLNFLNIRGARGKTPCKKEEILIIGNTGNKNYKNILCKLTQLNFIKEINQVVWE